MSTNYLQLKIYSNRDIGPIYQAIRNIGDEGATIGEPTGPSSELFESLINTFQKLEELN
jgi:hypothetical protein